MLQTQHAIALTAGLFWVMVMTAAGLRNGFGIPGLRVSLSNREKVPEPSPVAGRADRAAKNMLENLVLFGIALFAGVGGEHPDRVKLGVNLFFFARLAYFPVYLAGITYLRTVLWAAGVVGVAMIASSAF
jgi:uncharacterized MAPEG superfamily protein